MFKISQQFEKVFRQNQKGIIFFLAIVLIILGVDLKDLDVEGVLEDSARLSEQDSEKAPETGIETLAEPREIPPGFYEVTKIVDGDTLSVDMAGKNTTIRLIGIDTPETVHPSKPIQCFGIEASNKAKELLSGQIVRIETDPTQGEVDKYGRTLAYIFLEDGTNFNEQMIKNGYAYEYTFGGEYKYQSLFKSAQKEAETNKFGLWADGVCDGDF